MIFNYAQLNKNTYLNDSKIVFPTADWIKTKLALPSLGQTMLLVYCVTLL